MTLPLKTVNGGMVRAGEKFVVTEFLVKEQRRQSSCLLPAWNSPSCREGDLSCATCTDHKSGGNGFLQWGTLPSHLGPPVTILVCHLMFDAKDMVPSAAGMVSGQMAAGTSQWCLQ